MKNIPHWPHAPMHRLSGRGTYIVTAGTYQKDTSSSDRNAWKSCIAAYSRLRMSSVGNWKHEQFFPTTTISLDIPLKTVMTLRASQGC